MRPGRGAAAVLLAAALVAPALAGCRGPDAAAPAATAVSDPLADIEATLQAVEQELDAGT